MDGGNFIVIKKKEDNSFGAYTFEDVLAAEADNYVIQIGSEFFSWKGKVAFNLKRTEMFYEDILGGLNEMKKSQNEIERDDAINCLQLLKIYPFRIH
jgi:hypothetical protein